MQIIGNGVTRSKATAVAETPIPYDTQQIGVDNSLIPGFRTMVGITRSRTSAQIVY